MSKPTDEDSKTTPFIREEGGPVLPEETFRVPVPQLAPLAMFGHYKEAKARKLPGWAIPLMASWAFIVLAFLGVTWASSIWQIERLDRPKGSSLDIAIAPAPPPPPPPPGGAKPQTQTITPKKKTVKDIVQQVKIEKPQTETSHEEAGDPNGEEGGVEGGVAGGVAGGVITDQPPPPPPPPAPPQNVPPTLLEGSRIAGDKNIVPNDVTKTEIQRSGKDKIVGSFKLCITVDGVVNTISQLKSTGFAAYDGKIQSEMRNWRYRPYMVNGRAVPVCTAVTFIYSQK